MRANDLQEIRSPRGTSSFSSLLRTLCPLVLIFYGKVSIIIIPASYKSYLQSDKNGHTRKKDNLINCA